MGNQYDLDKDKVERTIYQQPELSMSTPSITKKTSFFGLFGNQPKSKRSLLSGRSKSDLKLNEVLTLLKQLEGKEYKQLDFQTNITSSTVRVWGSLTEDELRQSHPKPSYRTLESVPLSGSASVRNWSSLTEDELKNTMSSRQSFHSQRSVDLYQKKLSGSSSVRTKCSNRQLQYERGTNSSNSSKSSNDDPLEFKKPPRALPEIETVSSDQTFLGPLLFENTFSDLPKFDGGPSYLPHIDQDLKSVDLSAPDLPSISAGFEDKEGEIETKENENQELEPIGPVESVSGVKPLDIPSSKQYSINTSFSWEKGDENRQEILDMKEFILKDESTVLPAVTPAKTLELTTKPAFEKVDYLNGKLNATDKATSPERVGSNSIRRLSVPGESVPVSPNRTFHSLDWRKVGKGEESAIVTADPLNLLNDVTEVNEAIASALTIRKSMKRSKPYKETHVAISASSEDTIALDSIVELQEPRFVEKTQKLTEVAEPILELGSSSDEEDVDYLPADDIPNGIAEDVHGNVIESLNNEIEIKAKAVVTSDFDPVLPDQKVPAMVFAPPKKSVKRKPVPIMIDGKDSTVSNVHKVLPPSSPASLEWNKNGPSSAGSDQSITKNPLKWFKNLLKKEKSFDKAIEYPVEVVPSDRLTLADERHIYSISHTKLAESSRPFYQIVLITNLMLYILSVHSDVTIHGRGPRRLKKKRNRRKKPFIQVQPKRRSIQKIESNGSSSEEEEEDSKDEDDEDDDVPLAILKKKS